MRSKGSKVKTYFKLTGLIVLFSLIALPMAVYGEDGRGDSVNSIEGAWIDNFGNKWVFNNGTRDWFFNDVLVISSPYTITGDIIALIMPTGTETYTYAIIGNTLTFTPPRGPVLRMTRQ